MTNFLKSFLNLFDVYGGSYRGPYHDSIRVYSDARLTGAEKDQLMRERDAQALRGDWNRVGQDMRNAMNKYDGN